MERRKNKRFASKLFVKLNSGSAVSWGALGNVSENGLFIRSNRNFNINAVISVEVFMPDKTVSLLKGIVKRSTEFPGQDRKFGIGVQLTERDETYKHFLQMVGAQERTPPEFKNQTSHSTVC